MLLSIIIPAYNVEGTLRECLESVLSQHVDDMEIILVDDGSTDNTAEICDEFGIRDNIKVIHQENAGLSEARNAGLELAEGELITFVDSDDYLEPNTYPRLIGIMERHPQYDILEYSIVKEDNGKVLFSLDLPDREYTDMAQYWFDGRAYTHCYACNKVYRRGLFHGVRYPKGKKFEDVYMLPQLLRNAKVVRTTHLGLYHYIYNVDGITVSADGNALFELLKAHLPLINDKTLRSYNGFEEYYYHVLNIQISTYVESGNDGYIQLPTLPYHHRWKLKLLHLLGMKQLCRLFRKAKRL
jgi:glycosyltransferase involved in cell wall biosynthesis